MEKMYLNGEMSLRDKRFQSLPFVERLMERDPFLLDSFGITSKRDFDLADKVLRQTGLSIYWEIEDEATEGGNAFEPHLQQYCWAVHLRTKFYDGQIKDPNVTKRLHDETVMVTFDGLKGSGKTGLAKSVGKFLLSLDPGITEGRSALLGIPLKVSEFLSEGINPEITHHQRKVQGGERVAVPGLHFSGRLMQHALMLSRLAYEAPPLVVFDRSYITSLAKASDFIGQVEHDIIDRLHRQELKFRGYVGCKADDFGESDRTKNPKYISREVFVAERYAGHSNELKMFYFLEYLVDHMKGMYVVPDLSVVLLCDAETSMKRQRNRNDEIGREPIAPDEEELAWYKFFSDISVFPNAIYLDTVSSPRDEQFRQVVTAIKERCEDKGLDNLVRKMTSEAVDSFLTSNPLL